MAAYLDRPAGREELVAQRADRLQGREVEIRHGDLGLRRGGANAPAAVMVSGSHGRSFRSR
jgi:hypothetical protein